ncbi:MAG: transposase [Deltaproteobacteria bacterium]|nr:transposase [Deltaproteobacteria bacterium]
MHRRSRKRRRAKQLGFRFRTWGGARKGAGRKRTLPGRPRVSHRARPDFKKSQPLHVTTRIRNHVPRLRTRKRAQVIRAALLAVADEPGFRVVHFSVQGDHLHLILEADDKRCLARGMKRLKQRITNGLNRQLRRKGSVFADRYHLEVIRNCRQVRNTLVYVLRNAFKHGSRGTLGCGIDPYSSSWWFDGWADDSWRRGLGPPAGAPCVQPAATWMLKNGWRRYGLVSPTQVHAT